MKIRPMHPVAAPAFLSGEAKEGGRHFRGQVYYYYIWLPTYFHNMGHILHYSKFPPFLLISLFSLLLVIPFLSTTLSFPSPAPLPPLIQLGAWGSAVSSPMGPGGARPPNGISGPRNERFLTCQSGKLQCSLNSLIGLYVFDSVTV